MSKKLGLVYMGSKRSIAPKLLATMRAYVGEPFNLLDLFGGGGAMSFAAYASPFVGEVWYNEFNGQPVQLLKHTLNVGTLEEACEEFMEEFVTRDQYMNLRNGNSLDAAKCLYWAFGVPGGVCNYIMSADIEASARLAHQFICHEAIKAGGSIHKGLQIYRNNKLKAAIDLATDKRFRYDPYSRYQHFLNIVALPEREKRIHAKLNVIYCDIPYGDTWDYRLLLQDSVRNSIEPFYLRQGFQVTNTSYDGSANDYDRTLFINWCLSRKEPVFVSEHKLPEEYFKLILDYTHTNTNGRFRKNQSERLFICKNEWYKKDLATRVGAFV